jgi:hypothetical protein
MKKSFRLMAALVLSSCSALAQTTTGTAQKIGDFWYYNFYTQPAPQIQVYRPLQVPLVDTFQPFRQSMQGLEQALQYKQQLQLQQQQLELQRQQNEILARQQIKRLTDPAPDPAPITTTIQQDANKAGRQAKVDQCVGGLLRVPEMLITLAKGEKTIQDVQHICDSLIP